MRTKALDEGNCAAARPGGKEAGVKTTSPRTETGCEAGDADELAPHSEVRVSASQVKPGVVSRKSHPLPGETSAWADRATGRDWRRQRCRPCRGVSRGRSSAGNEPGVGVHLLRGALKGPEGLTHARRTKLVGTAETAAASRPAIELVWGGRKRRRKTAVGRIQTSLVDFWSTYRDRPAPPVGSRPSEPPGTDPYAGWCGGRGGKPPRLPD